MDGSGTDLLIAEDLLLLLLDDEKGTMPAATQHQPLLGGALLIELALDGLVEVGEKHRLWRTTPVHATAGVEPSDPELRAAVRVVAAKQRNAQDLVNRIGKGARERLLGRLVARGILEQREGRFLGLFPHTTWPAADVAHERQVRQRLHDILVTGLEPDPRSASLVALLHAVGQVHKQVGAPGVPAGDVRRRAKAISEGAWAADAVRDAVQASQAAMTAAVAAATTAATASSGS
ncbi:hypothetical protein GCM10009623_06840 [Nocardioides aestuarii]|uniref:GPP34 family phosphoprotein n=1 Tax=Nocardioides aestuarii TaxID=252231 RepID=A0ABW4TFG7_9ACTN